MTNDKCPMTKEAQMTKPEMLRRAEADFVIRALSFIRNSSLAIRHFPRDTFPQ